MSRRESSTLTGERWEGVIKGYRPSHRQIGRSRGWRRILRYVAVLGLIILLGGGSLYTYSALKVKANQRKIEGLKGEVSNQPINFLLLGSDSRAGLSPRELAKYDPTGEDRKTGRRADTIMLFHVDEKNGNAVLISFPRDLRVTYPNGKVGKINGLYNQGPDSMVAEISRFTGLSINHYVEVNFSGFNKIVAALGGVDVFFERPIRDADSGLSVPKGCVHLSGDQALAFVRVRHIDDDFQRIRRQQLFIKLMLDKVKSPGTILNPLKVLKLVNLFAQNVTTDQGLSIRQVQGLALRLGRFDSSKVDMRQIPSTTQSIRGVSYVIYNRNQTEAIFRALRNGTPLPDFGRTGVSPIDPGDIEIAALNGTTIKGLASRAAEDLKAKEFKVTMIADADNTNYSKTTVYFSEGNEDKANFVATKYNATVKPMPKSIAVNAPLALVAGPDFGSIPQAAASSATPSVSAVRGAPRPTTRACS